MVWLLRKKTDVVSRSAHGSPVEARDSLYVPRHHIEKPIADALARSGILVIYGPSHQGKTSLLSRYLDSSNSIYIECRPGFKRTQIYRVMLYSLGYSLLIGKRKRGKATATFKLGVAWTGAEASAEGESEQTMQSINIDLKNPSEVAHLISRIKQLPWTVLDNFQLLDSTTQENLLFDLVFFAERAGIRIIIVGPWPYEDFLEEIEPAIAGKYRQIFVPTWSNEELRAAAAKWSAQSKAFNAVMPHLEDYVALAGGDISLFRMLLEGSIGERARQAATTPADLPIQALILRRFRRGLSSILEAIFEQRGSYLTYYGLKPTTRLITNNRFHPIPNARESEYVTTAINPYTNRPYPGGDMVLLDRDGNPQYVEESTWEVILMKRDIVRFLMRRICSAAQQGSSEIGLTQLAQEFEEELLPEPVGLDRSRLKAVFATFDEVQRRALIVPPLLAVNSARDSMEIADRRLFLFLSSVTADDLEELLDDAQPSRIPPARRRNQISPNMTDDEKEAYVAKLMQRVPISNRLGEEQRSSDDSSEVG